MNLGRIMGVILSVLAISFFINIETKNNSDNKNTLELVGSIGRVQDNNVNFDTFSLNDNNDSNVEVIRYTNKQPYTIDITSSNVVINCKGNSSKDVDLVKNNMRTKAYFSKIDDSQKTTSIKVKSKETINIYVVNEYVGEYYPNSEVFCEYSINIHNI